MLNSLSKMYVYVKSQNSKENINPIFYSASAKCGCSVKLIPRKYLLVVTICTQPHVKQYFLPDCNPSYNIYCAKAGRGETFLIFVYDPTLQSCKTKSLELTVTALNNKTQPQARGKMNFQM